MNSHPGPLRNGETQKFYKSSGTKITSSWSWYCYRVAFSRFLGGFLVSIGIFRIPHSRKSRLRDLTFGKSPGSLTNILRDVPHRRPRPRRIYRPQYRTASRCIKTEPNRRFLNSLNLGTAFPIWLKSWPRAQKISMQNLPAKTLARGKTAARWVAARAEGAVFIGRCCLRNWRGNNSTFSSRNRLPPQQRAENSPDLPLRGAFAVGPPVTHLWHCLKTPGLERPCRGARNEPKTAAKTEPSPARHRLIVNARRDFGRPRVPSTRRSCAASCRNINHAPPWLFKTKLTCSEAVDWPKQNPNLAWVASSHVLRAFALLRRGEIPGW